MNADQLLSLPWAIQLSLAGGYTAYILAYSGIRSRHTTLDVAFLTLAFGLVATAVLALLAGHSAFVAAPAAFCAALISAYLWRKWGRGLCSRFMRWSDLSWSNDDQSALESVCANTKHKLSQVGILLDDGTWLQCDNTVRFAGEPFGPCLIGPTGDVALYLTHEEDKDGKVKELKSVVDPHYGARLTYVPANRIKRITLRYIT